MKKLIFITLVCSAFVSSCSWFGVSDEKRRLENGESAKVVIPPNLDQPQFVDLMPIPDFDDYRGLGEQSSEVRMPEGLSTSFGVEQIVIRKLGDERWVFLDLPTATIWPQVLLFWDEANLPLAMRDPRTGTMETEWLSASGSTAEEIFDNLRKGTAFTNQLSPQQYKFRIRVEPGVRTGSTELYVDQKQRVSGVPYRAAEIDWSSGSDDSALEGKVLSDIAYYLGERVAQGPTVSLLAANLQASKATLNPEEDGLVLRYQLNFDRAWATVGAALEDARIDVADLDRSSADYFVYYTSQHDPDPGFFSKLFSFGDKKQEKTQRGHRFRVHLEPVDSGETDEVRVTVASDAVVADLGDTDMLLLSERLLKLIKEYST